MSKYTSKTLIKYIILAGIASFVIIFLIMQFTSGFDYSKLGESIGKINWWWVAAAAGTNLVSFVFEALQLVFLSSAIGKRLGFWRAMQIYFVGNFFSNATPSTSGGEPMQIYFLQDDGFTIAEGTVMVMIRGLISIMVRLVFVIVIVVAVVAFGFQMTMSKFLDTVFYVTLIGYMVLFFIGLFCIIYPTMFAFIVKFLSQYRWVRRLMKADTKEECIEKGMRFLLEIRSAALLMLKGRRWHVALAVFNSIFTWAMLKTMPFFAMLALGESPNIFAVFAIGVISQLATAWVPTPGAVGGIEVGMQLFGTLMLYPDSNLGFFVLIYRFMDYHMDVGIGGPVALTLLFRKLGKGAANKDLSQITGKIEEQMDFEKEHEISQYSQQQIEKPQPEDK